MPPEPPEARGTLRSCLTHPPRLPGRVTDIRQAMAQRMAKDHIGVMTDATGTTSKEELRAALRARRRMHVEKLGGAQCRVHAIIMARIAFACLGPGRVVAGYLSNGREVDAMPLLELACARDIETALPHIAERDGPMRFLSWRPGDPLVRGPYGTPQPHAGAPEVAPDAIITPLVGFDSRRNRLGQGGGYYDRIFARLPDARRIGLAWSVQEVPELPVESWDQPLHAVVTEKTLIGE